MVPMIGICHGTELRQLSSADRFSTEVIDGCRKIDRIMALSSYQKEKIKSSYGIDGDKIVVTGAGFNREVFYPRKNRRPEGRIKALYAGKLSSAKGVPSLIRAVSQLPMPRDAFRLILAGSGCGSEYEDIKTLARECPFEIEFTGFLPQASLAQLMQGCHLFIMPSFYEGFSLVTMEALASGLRVVSNDLPGIREWVGPSLAEQGIIEYVAMPGLRSADVPLVEDLPAYENRLRAGIFKQAVRAREFSGVLSAGYEEMVRKYSWEAVFVSIENIYQDLICDKNY